MSRTSKALMVLLALLVCLGAASNVFAQWTGDYSSYGAWMRGGVSNGYDSPYGWSHTGLGWMGAGVGENSPYETGFRAGFGPSGGGGVGVTLPGLGSYNFTW